jgi:hypothetical protein
MLDKCLRMWVACAVLGALPFSTVSLAECPFERVAELPLLAGRRPIVEVSIDGHPIQMVVDTGAQMTSVVPDVVADLALRADPERRTISRTVGGNIVSSNAIVDKLNISGLDFTELSVPVVPLSGAKDDPPAGGVIGADILHDFDVELDIPQRTLVLYRKQHCIPTQAPWQGPSQIVSGRVMNNRFIFPVLLSDRSLSAEFDTGSLGETVSRTSAVNIGITAAQLDSDPQLRGTSAGQQGYAIHQHKFDTFKVGTETFRGFPLDVVDFNQPDIDMLIGVDYMHWRRFYLSYSSGMLFIQREPDEKIRQELRLESQSR